MSREPTRLTWREFQGFHRDGVSSYCELQCITPSIPTIDDYSKYPPLKEAVQRYPHAASAIFQTYNDLLLGGVNRFPQNGGLPWAVQSELPSTNSTAVE